MQFTHLDDERPYCDAGCGDRATVQMEHVGYCDDCAAAAIREADDWFSPEDEFDLLRQQKEESATDGGSE